MTGDAVCRYGNEKCPDADLLPVSVNLRPTRHSPTEANANGRRRQGKVHRIEGYAASREAD